MNTEKSSVVQVAFLGPKGTFSHRAVLKHFGDTVGMYPCRTIDDVFVQVASGVTQYGVVPVENSTEGAVNNTQDCLLDTAVKVVGEVVVPIEHFLLRRKNSSQHAVEKIVSHKQSLAQCRKWLTVNWPDTPQLDCNSNAEAARLASEDPSLAAIAGSTAAEIYNLEMLASKIQDQQHNSTRFLVLAMTPVPASGSDKTSVLIYTENKPGALFRVLEPFERIGVSLTKIETRPSQKEAWDYVFFIDFEGHAEDEVIKRLFDKLRQCTAEIKVLGSYPLASVKSDG